MTPLTRRTALLGSLFALGGCSTISALNSATQALDTYDLVVPALPQRGARSAQTLLVARPQASAALSSDRIMIKPDPASITYLPDARWSDEVPALVQSLLIRSIAATGRIAYVGPSDAGPVPDKALLTRIDAFEVNALPGGLFEVVLDMEITLVNDADQRIVASRRFAQRAPAASDGITQVVGAFQQGMNAALPEIAAWVIAQI